MLENNMKTPILYLVFNRLDLVEKSFAKIKNARPKVLFVAADGPRADAIEDERKCYDVRNYIKQNIDWECEVSYLFREKNLGCGLAVSQAISWFFENVEEGIILEDDCLPGNSFFPFCEELLIKYRDNKKVYHIGGSNWQKGNKRGDADYYFSNIPGIWGWATWSDRWADYKFDIFKNKENWQKLDKRLPEITNSEEEKVFQLKCFNSCKNNQIDTWDYQWRFLVFIKKGLCIVPNKNLVSNLGHREDSAHTKDSSHWRANLNIEEMGFPLKHPKRIAVNRKADKFLADHLFLNKTKKKNIAYKYLKKVKGKSFKLFKKIID
ncbi:hypothetical protein [Salegentibacter sediminis]|uniref:hypothetical protein n=1 Tax=Salegentibacter sediminis TaxID=1930251 RepID=UPI0009BFB7DE|nr:hypothetical protein [Salegentibacter sediminis]